MKYIFLISIAILSILNGGLLMSQPITGSLQYNQVMALGGPLYATSTTFELKFSQDESIVQRIGDGRMLHMQGDTTIQKFNSIPKNKGIIYKNRKTQRLISRETAFRKKVIVDDTLKIDWKINKKTKLIGKFKCREAEADVFGRHYIAWFTSEIPVSDGPWKLHGLPGLILEAKEESGKIEFLFESVSIPPTTGLTIEPILQIEKEKPLTTKEYIKLAKENANNFSNMMSSNPKYPGGSVRVDVKTIELFPDDN